MSSETEFRNHAHQMLTGHKFGWPNFVQYRFTSLQLWPEFGQCTAAPGQIIPCGYGSISTNTGYNC